jgi:hypothetical protein
MRSIAPITGLLMLFVSGGAWAVAEPESVSLQDLRPECKERHPALPPEQCIIQDRAPVRQYVVRRSGESAITIVPTPPATGEPRTAPATPAGASPIAAPR